MFDWLIFCLQLHSLHFSSSSSSIGYIWCLFSLFEASCAARLLFLAEARKTAKKNPAGVMGLIGVWKAKTMSEIETKDRLFRPTKSISWNGEKTWCGKAPGKFPLRGEREDFRCIRSGTEIFNLNKSATWGWRMSRANVFNHQRDLCECNARLLCLVSSYTFVMVEISGGWWAEDEEEKRM